MATKSVTEIEQLNIIAEELKKKNFLFKESEDDSDTDENDTDESDADDDSIEALKNEMKEMNSLFILFLGSMTPNVYLDKSINNCLYNQVAKHNSLLKKNKEILHIVNIVFIGGQDKKNKNIILNKIRQLTHENVYISIEYILQDLPIIDSTKKIEQLFLLKDKFFTLNKKARFKSINSNERLNEITKNETSEDFKFNTNKGEIIFKKPTIPIINSNFFTVLEELLSYFNLNEITSKAIIVNGFWFDTNVSLQDDSDSFLVENMSSSFISNILFGWIPYFIPFISKMKKMYKDNFMVVNQYFHQIEKFACTDVSPHILSAMKDVTANGIEFQIE